MLTTSTLTTMTAACQASGSFRHLMLGYFVFLGIDFPLRMVLGPLMCTGWPAPRAFETRVSV
jgi:hypothetical protein